MRAFAAVYLRQRDRLLGALHGHERNGLRPVAAQGERGRQAAQAGRLTAKKVKNGSLLEADFKAPAAADAFVSSNGSVFAPAARKITSTNVSHTAGTGVYCFQDLPFVQRSAMAASTGFFATELDVVTNVSVTPSGPDCPDSFTKRTTRVLTWDIGASAPADRSFVIWQD